MERGVSMRRIFMYAVSGMAACLIVSTIALAGKANPAAFPLRVHIFTYNGNSHYSYGALETVDGEGRANLYENGEPRGFDFSYRCSVRLRVSPGFETYMARWKKEGREIEILLPEFGKPGAAESCDLKVLMKDTTYFRHNGLLGEEPAAVFKAWMVKHQYDPEHGMNEPVYPASATPQEGQQPAPQPGSGTNAAH